MEETIDILTGGTHPADAVHPEAIEAMREVGIDISDREPQNVSTQELNDCDIVATMGCSTLELEADVEVRDWALDDPHGEDMERVREIRDDIRQRVAGLFTEYLD